MTVINTTIRFPEIKLTVGTGWLPPYLDRRDYTVEHPKIAEIIEKLDYTPEVHKKAQTLEYSETEEPAPQFLFVPNKADLRKWCSPIENQGGLGSCSAHAAAGIVEYYEKKAFNKYIDGSRLFIYKTTRNLLGWVGDTGAFVRTTMGALRLCGCPPEKYWPYTDQKPDFDEEPTPFVYSLAEDYEAIKYFAHDPIGGNVTPGALLRRLRFWIARGIPAMFGFYGFDSFGQSRQTGEIPFPCQNERVRWGHAVVAVGYDDNKIIKNNLCDTETKGALLIRNSWSTGWGDNGYGWLPYEYVRQRYALDFWSLISMEWVDTGEFGL